MRRTYSASVPFSRFLTFPSRPLCQSVCTRGVLGLCLSILSTFVYACFMLFVYISPCVLHAALRLSCEFLRCPSRSFALQRTGSCPLVLHPGAPVPGGPQSVNHEGVVCAAQSPTEPRPHGDALSTSEEDFRGRTWFNHRRPISVRQRVAFVWRVVRNVCVLGGVMINCKCVSLGRVSDLRVSYARVRTARQLASWKWHSRINTLYCGGVRISWLLGTTSRGWRSTVRMTCRLCD